MHITVVAVGSRGDVQPYVALGAGVRSAGHRVRVATHEIHAPLVGACGLEFRPIGGNPRKLLEGRAGQTWMASGGDPVSFWRKFRKVVAEGVEEAIVKAQDACRGTDAIVYSVLGAAGYHVAEAMGVPRIMAPLQPFGRTREFPIFSFPPLPPGSRFNLWTYRLAEQVLWWSGRRRVNHWRKESLGLEKLGLRGPFPEIYARREPFLYGFSETVVPRPRDWPDHHRVAGYWFLDAAMGWSPPDSLVDFLASGPRPVYVGFGSMSGHLARDLLPLAVKAVTRAKQRAVLVGGWASEGEDDLPEEVYALKEVPHDWLFPRMAALVHHGGAGTTAAGLRAGIPTVVVPFFSDQPFWGRRVHALGAGPQPIHRKHVTVEGLAGAISVAVWNRRVAARASAVGEKLRSEDGVDRGVEGVLEALGEVQ